MDNNNLTEKIIEHVKKHEALFNLAHPNFRNVRIKNKIWDEIAEELKLGRIGGKTGGEDLKKRWKNLRDCYAKYLRSEKAQTGQQAKSVCRYKTWPWAQHMEVFRSYIQFAQTESNDIVESPKELKEETESMNQTSQNPPKESRVELNRPSRKILRAGRVGIKRKLPSTSQSSVEKVIHFLKEKYSNNENNSNDEIDLIFLAYAASVKKLPSRSQTLIKFKIAKMIMEEELSQQAQIEGECRPGTSTSTLSSAHSRSLSV